ncbi:MAG: AI-2E family transporter [Bacilli bacterium]|jgi:predicted PurR-regulated permease PerM|nr:AI-2E family transporter [Bacilli bacterium]
MNNKKEKIDYVKLNEVVSLSQRILKLAIIFISIIGIYAITLILKEWHIFGFIFTILSVLVPFFIGLVIAWLLEPIVKYLYNMGINRILGSILVYVIMLGILYLGFTLLFPIFLEQINDFIKILPGILEDGIIWVERFTNNFKNISFIDIEVIKTDMVNYFNDVITSITTEIPTMMINFIKGLFSTIGIFSIGLLIGFYLLVSTSNMKKIFLSLLPVRVRRDVIKLLEEANVSFFAYLKGTILTSTLVFVITATGLWLIGVKASLLLGFICGLTNIIPYIGPYLGGAVAAIVAFSQSVPLGIITLTVISIIQTIEGNIIQPLIMSKTMKLHPVTIIIGLLIFGYFFGILGMIIATPLIAVIKSIAIFVENKYHLFDL